MVIEKIKRFFCGEPKIVKVEKEVKIRELSASDINQITFARMVITIPRYWPEIKARIYIIILSITIFRGRTMSEEYRFEDLYRPYKISKEEWERFEDELMNDGLIMSFIRVDEDDDVGSDMKSFDGKSLFSDESTKDSIVSFEIIDTTIPKVH